MNLFEYNVFEYDTGKLLINGKKYELTKTESEILKKLIDNKLKTYEEMYNAIYNVSVRELDRSTSQCLNVHVSRMRKKGLKIVSKYNYGMRLLDKIVLI